MAVRLYLCDAVIIAIIFIGLGCTGCGFGQKKFVYGIPNGREVHVLADPGETGWGFSYRVTDGGFLVVPDAWCGVGRLRHARQEFFVVRNIPDTDLYVLHPKTTPKRLILVIDNKTLQFSSWSSDLSENDKLLLMIRKTTNDPSYQFGSFQGGDDE